MRSSRVRVRRHSRHHMLSTKFYDLCMNLMHQAGQVESPCPNNVMSIVTNEVNQAWVLPP